MIRKSNRLVPRDRLSASVHRIALPSRHRRDSHGHSAIRPTSQSDGPWAPVEARARLQVAEPVSRVTPPRPTQKMPRTLTSSNSQGPKLFFTSNTYAGTSQPPAALGAIPRRFRRALPAAPRALPCGKGSRVVSVNADLG